MPDAFRYPPKPARGDAVAVLSPSGRSAARFAAPYELGLRRLRDELGLVPVEYPTTRAAEASPAERAADVHAAFADPRIRAIVASIGGEDEIEVLPHLHTQLLAANPKPFVGYSDNTNLHLVLWNLGLVSYHGGAVMVQLGRPGSMHPVTRRSLERALFTRGTYAVEPDAAYGDEEGAWDDPAALSHEPPMLPAPGWSWHGPAVSVTGPAWGGNLEIIGLHLREPRHLPAPERLDGCILFAETSEELPPAGEVRRLLGGLAARGSLQRFAGVVWARPKAWSFEQRNDLTARRRYTEEQRRAVLAALADHHPGVPILFGVDFGHTDPQHVIPSGGAVTLDAERRRLLVTY